MLFGLRDMPVQYNEVCLVDTRLADLGAIHDANQALELLHSPPSWRTRLIMCVLHLALKTSMLSITVPSRGETFRA